MCAYVCIHMCVCVCTCVFKERDYTGMLACDEVCSMTIKTISSRALHMRAQMCIHIYKFIYMCLMPLDKLQTNDNQSINH